MTIGAAALFAIVGGYTNDAVGRKPTILLASFVFTAGAVLLGVTLNREMLLVGRIIVGVGIGKSACHTINLRMTRLKAERPHVTLPGARPLSSGLDPLI